MKLLSFNEFLNEGVITPYDIDSIIKKLQSDSSLTLEKANKIASEVSVKFITIEEFIDNLKTEEEKNDVPRNLNLGGGVRFGAFNPYTKMTYICVHPEEFLSTLNDEEQSKQLYPFIREILRHESIHIQQMSKAKKDFHNSGEKVPNSLPSLNRSPSSNSVEYFSHKTEIMAYAQSFIDQCHVKKISKEQILSILRTGKPIVSWIQNVYKGMDEKTLNTFKKYVYQYLDQEAEN